LRGKGRGELEGVPQHVVRGGEENLFPTEREVVTIHGGLEVWGRKRLGITPARDGDSRNL